MLEFVTPELDEDAVADLAYAHWGVEGPWQRLPGENLNYRGRDGVLKIALISEDQLQCESMMSERLGAAGVPVPALQPTVQSKASVAVPLGSEIATARMFTCLPGQIWRNAPSTRALRMAVGDMLGQVHQCLSGPIPRAAMRTHPWDVSNAMLHRHAVKHVRDLRLRVAVDRSLMDLTCLDLHSLPQAWLHGDFNDENVLVENEVVTGVLDFGDTLSGARVQDLAIAMAYVLQHEGVQLADGADVVEAYAARMMLTREELRALPILISARLATSLCMSAMRAREDPTRSNWFVHEDSTAKTLVALQSHTPAEITAVLCERSRSSHSAKSETLLARRSRLGPSLSLSYASPLHITRGQGAYLESADGRCYLDLVNNVCHVGHCHPHVVAALSQQASQLNTNTRYLHESVLEYAERLCATMPSPLDTCIFVNSGSEANELALRMARVATGHHDVAVIDGAYHGNTGRCIEMSPYKFNGPGGMGCPPWVHVTPMPDVYRGEIRDANAGAGYGLEVGRVIGEAASSGRAIAAFFFESMLSCGGQMPLPQGYLETAFDHVRSAGGLCVADEVQVGFGRVGDAMWGFQLHDVIPDLVVLGKPMGNGHPMGAVVTSSAIAKTFANGMEFFSSFGGNPVSASVGQAVLDVIEAESLQASARTLGLRFIDGLKQLQHKHDIIGDVRGCGLFIGVELVRSRETLEPAPEEATHLVELMKERGVLLSTDGPLRNVIKIKPPMVLAEDDVDMTLRHLDAILSGI